MLQQFGVTVGDMVIVSMELENQEDNIDFD